MSQAEVILTMAAAKIRVADQHQPIVWANEHDVQAALAGVLKPLELQGLSVEREVRLSNPRNRIDFLIRPQDRDDLAVGIEVKVKGESSSIRKQLDRYSAEPIIHALLLVTTRPAHHYFLLGDGTLADDVPYLGLALRGAAL